MNLANLKCPIALVCPKCQRDLVFDGTSCACGAPIGLEEGIPRLLFGQDYWGETSRDKMNRILSEVPRVGWRMALSTVVHDEPVHRHLTSGIRADLLHALPWNSIGNVLDIGAGMGFMTFDLAQYAESVVALEAVPERARFIQLRAVEEGARVFPVIGSGLEAPFPEQSFDLITMNGVFEYAGLWGVGDPEQVQVDLLRRLKRLLRPGGILYIGIEARYGLRYFFGARDHSGLPYTSVLPRALADAACRMFRAPIYGSEKESGAYRTYTYSPNGYRRLFGAAGFCGVTILGLYDGYNRQEIIYSLDNLAVRRSVLGDFNPPTTRAGKWRRCLTNSYSLSALLENEVGLLAAKEGPEKSVPFGRQSNGATFAQVNTASKMMLIEYLDNEPQRIWEREKCDRRVAAALQKSFDSLRVLDRCLGDEAATWGIRWARPQEALIREGRRYFVYEYAKGPSLSALFGPALFDENRVVYLVGRVLAAYPYMSKRIYNAGVFPRMDSLIDRLSLPSPDEFSDVASEVLDELGSNLREAQTAKWDVSTIHGDLAATNLRVDRLGRLILVDWEDMDFAAPIGIELVRFWFDVVADSRVLSPKARQRLIGKLRLLFLGALQDEGYRNRDIRLLECVCLIHQFRLFSHKKGPAVTLTGLWADRQFCLSE